jgi:hypothetical protein
MVPCLSAGRLVSQRAQTSYKEKANTPFFIDFSAGAKGLRVGGEAASIFERRAPWLRQSNSYTLV